MKIGTFISIFDNNWAEDFTPLLHEDFDFFEVLPEYPFVLAEEVKNFVNGKEIIIHAPFVEPNLIATESIFRETARKFYQQKLSPYVALFHPKVITVHLGRMSFLYPEINLDSFQELQKVFPQLTFENMPASNNKWMQAYPWDTEQINTLQAQSNSRMTFDVGHFFTQGLDVYELVEKYMPSISHIHIHDIKNGKDHQPLGVGDLDIERFLNILNSNKYNNYLSIELASNNVSGAIDSLHMLKKYVK